MSFNYTQPTLVTNMYNEPPDTSMHIALGNELTDQSTTNCDDLRKMLRTSIAA